jgi:anti-anti-sigma factor
VSDFKTIARTTAAGPVVDMAGELDHHSVAQLRESIESLTLKPGEQLVLNLSALTFCDSSGITAFIVARNKALQAEAGIALAGVPEHIERVLRIVGLDQVFPIHPDAQSAAAAWKSSADSP